MKLGCSSWSYQQAIVEKRLDQAQWLRLCADELDLDGVELLDIHFPTLERDYLGDVKKFCTDHGMTISCVSVSNDFGVPGEERQLEQIAKVKQWVNIAAYFGAPVLRVFAGWISKERWKGDEASTKLDCWPDAIAGLTECTEYAAERGIVLGIENHNGYGIVGTADEVERCLREVGSSWLRLNLDTGDYKDIESIRRTLPLAVHVHAKLYDLGANGLDAQDWPAIMSVLREGRYRGFLSIEYEGKDDPMTEVPRAVSALRRLLAAGASEPARS
jgi:sugar phosphate isomerase/epimerase